MSEEFNLKKKRKLLLKNTIEAFSINAITLEDVFIEVKKQDKEFIRRLKGEIIEGLKNLEGLSVVKRIDKLAGEKLR